MNMNEEENVEFEKGLSGNAEKNVEPEKDESDAVSKNSEVLPDLGGNYESSYENDYYSSNRESNKISFELTENTSKDMKLIALITKIMSILGMISGGIACLTIFGAIVGIPYILVALKFYKAAESLSDTLAGKDGKNINKFFEETAKAYKIYLIMLIISIVLSIFLSIIMVIVIISAASSY